MTGERPVNTCAHQYVTIERRVPTAAGRGVTRLQTVAVCRHCKARRTWHFTWRRKRGGGA